MICEFVKLSLQIIEMRWILACLIYIYTLQKC